MSLTHYQNQADLPDRALLEKDGITFSVLVSIMAKPCQDIYTDHENIIICFSRHPYPVWVFCQDPEDLALVSGIGNCLKAAFPLEKGYHYNLSYALLESLKKTDAYFKEIEIKINLLSYRLDKLQPLSQSSDGHVRLAEKSDIDILAQLYHDGAWEMEGHDFSIPDCKDMILEKMKNRGVFVLEVQGQIAAITCKGLQAPYGKVSMVYTVPKYRRHGYALHLVHQVTSSIIEDGLTPILYTDADYAASNACYQKIGYQVVGSLCTVQGSKNNDASD